MAGKKTKIISYSECLGVGARAAAYPNANSSTFVPFYHDSTLITTTSDCNREHTWPNSRGSGESGPGADPFIIRPTLKSENSDRSNYFYGTRGKSNKEWVIMSSRFHEYQVCRSDIPLTLDYAFHKIPPPAKKDRYLNLDE